MTVGQNIKAIRKERGLTQKELGEACGIDEANIRKYELGKANPKIETVEKIAKALGVPIVRIKEDLTWAEHQNTEEVKQLERSTLLFEGIVVALEEIYGTVEEKSIMGETGWERPYWLVGKAPNSFILYEDDIEALVKSAKASIPALVDRLKDTRPEAEVIQEIASELNQMEPPKQ